VTASEYSIHEFAALAGVTVKALHHYDSLGLLRPRRTAARYRVYTPGDLTRVRQILALRALGLPLRRIGELLAAGAPPLQATLRQQRHVLEERRRSLERAIRAIATAETGLDAPGDGAEVLDALIEVMGMQDSIDEMRRYYSDDVWDAWRHHYEEWPSHAWRVLYRDVNDLLDADPSANPLSAAAQALGSRWLALDRSETTSGAVRTGLRKAWLDRERWPAALQTRLAEHRVDRATRFISSVLWERWEAERIERERTRDLAPPRVSDSRIALYRDCAAAATEDPHSEVAQRLVTRWRELLDAECNHDDALIHEQIQAWQRRRQWPPAMLRHVASWYAMDGDSWQRAADFLEAAYAHATTRSG
jgi:MerR family transcriptional regulator, thiopeptide resistance regulator